MKKKNVIAADKPKAKKMISKGLQSGVMVRLQNKGLTAKMAQMIVESKDDYLAEKMVEALVEAIRQEAVQEAS